MTPRRGPAAPPPATPETLRTALGELSETGAMSADELRSLLEDAVVEAYRRWSGDEAPVEARVNLTEQGGIELHRIDDGGPRPIPLNGDFARQAAMAAKAAVVARLRDAERERVVREVSARRGELVDSLVERQDGPLWWVRTDDHSALLPPEEQIPDERLERNQHLKVVVIDVRRRSRDAVVVVSRSHPLLLRQLLAQEVPEVASGQVVVKGIAREAGRRSKVAVFAPAGGIDPQGACIGPKGVRHRAVVSELGDEQVQIVAWSPDAAGFVASALAPATVVHVDLDEETRTARVQVPPDQLSLAIGRAGENARLAARLTGWRIDIGAEGHHASGNGRPAG